MWNFLASLVGGAVNAGVALYSQRRTNEARKRESELAWQRSQQQIKEQNAYNSASAQVARLQAAGLNPNLMYDNGQQASAGMQDNVAEYTPANYESGAAPAGAVGTDTINSLIGLKDLENKTDLAAADVALKSTQGLNQVAQAINASANTQQALAKTKLILQEWNFKELYNPLEVESKRVNIALDRNRSAKVLSDIRVNANLMRKISAETGLTLAETERIAGLWMYERDNIVSTMRNREYQNLNLAANAQLAYTNSDYLRGMLKVNFLRFYLDETMFFKNFSLDERKVKAFEDVVGIQRGQLELAQKRFKFDKYSFEVNNLINNGVRGFGQDMLNIGAVGINLMQTPLFNNLLTPKNPIGFGK